MHFWSGESAHPALDLLEVIETRPLSLGNWQVVSLFVGAAATRAAVRMVAKYIWLRKKKKKMNGMSEGVTLESSISERLLTLREGS